MIEAQLKSAKGGVQNILMLEDDQINRILRELAEILRENEAQILAANKTDLAKMKEIDPLFDRVLLNSERIENIAESLEEIASYDSPIGRLLEEKVLSNGLKLQKVSCPMGVVGAIFEARPNVVVDIFALCFKSQNVCVLKGGSQSEESNKVLVELIQRALGPGRENMCVLLPHEREVVTELLQADKYLDLIIPRGGAGLIDFVRKNSTVPVIETGAGVVHIYVDQSANSQMAAEIVLNAKTSRPSVCNSLDTLLIQRTKLADLVEICKRLAEFKVEIFADKEAFAELNGHYAYLQEAEEESFGREYLGLQMAIKVVAGLEEAVAHINQYGSRHSEAIISEDPKAVEYFMQQVDAAAVYHNASTRFTDGGVFGLGAEVGISTQKLHARGPMGIRELTSYKWLVYGEGQVRI